jgi:hypothetical protein
VEETVANKKVKNLKVNIIPTKNKFWTDMFIYQDLNHVEFVVGSVPTKAIPDIFTYKYKLGRALLTIDPTK